MWDESRALPAFSPARFAFAIRAIRAASALLPRRILRADGSCDGRRDSIDNGEIGWLSRDCRAGH
jgi:hypothetical protein